MNRLLYLLVALAALIAGSFGYYKSFYLALPENALYYQQPRVINSFELTDHLGNAFTKENFSGQWSWIFFGYTSCPDVCPTTLQELNFIYEDLTAIADNQILLVSVDPQRDSQQKLASYIGYFNKEFKALRADHSVLYPFARNMGLMYAITDNKEADNKETDTQDIDNKANGSSANNYLVDHSASLVLVNPEGLIAAIFKPEQVIGQTPSINGNVLLSDFAKIVRLH